ncbi:hypothetical protein HW132_31030 [Brasilonema sp. CT11]|nr:hypothetical protein [Brasilonema sp. CT11]
MENREERTKSKINQLPEAVIFLDAISDFITIKGACIEKTDKGDKVRLVCHTKKGALILMKPSDLEIYANRKNRLSAAQ